MCFLLELNLATVTELIFRLLHFATFHVKKGELVTSQSGPHEPEQDGMLLYRRVTSSRMSLVPIYPPRWRETMWVNVSCLRARTHRANFCLFCEKICHQFRETSAPGDFLIYQILSSLTKLQRCRRPASEQDKFLSGVKSDRFVNLHAMI